MKATIVFEKIWNAIHAVNTDGSRKYKYIINTGSSRSSKTFSILQAHWVMCLKNPNTRVSIWRETKADCKMTILADLKKAVPSFPNIENVVFNKTESIYTFSNGSTIEFMGGDEENRVHGFQGDIAHLNEPYKFGLEAFNQIDMRTSGFIIIDWNPKNKHWIDEVSKRDNAIVIHSTYKDNPFIPEEQKKKILSYDPSNPYNVEQGTADAYLHAVYALGLKAEKPNRIFKGWNNLTDKDFYKLPYQIYYGLDFGLSAPTSLVAMKFDGDENYFFKEILYKPLNDIKGSLTDEFERLGIEKHVQIICDSGNELNKEEARKLKNSGYNVIQAKKGSGSISAGIETMQKSKIHYTLDSTNLEQEYENYSWKVWQGIQMDVPEENGDDHALDAMKYVISWFTKVFRLS
jgi:PBSX family phage terminase large subunit